MLIVKGLDPIIDFDAEILILGSMPGNESIRKMEYYANPRNQFWSIMFALFDSKPETSYPEKVSFLKRRRIALWDVIKQCNREGSSDSKITQVRINDFVALFDNYPNLKIIYFNGQKAFNEFQKEVQLKAQSQIKLTVLASSSPANTVPLGTKIKDWTIIKTYAYRCAD